MVPWIHGPTSFAPPTPPGWLQKYTLPIDGAVEDLWPSPSGILVTLTGECFQVLTIDAATVVGAEIDPWVAVLALL